MEIHDGADRPGNVFALADNDDDKPAMEDLGCHDLSPSASSEDIEHLLEHAHMPTTISFSAPRSGPVRRGDSVAHYSLGSILNEKTDAGFGLPAWQGFFELPG